MSHPDNPLRQPLGQLLLAQGLVSEDQLRIALQEQQRQNIPMGRLLVQLGFVTEATLRDALGVTLGKRTVDLSHALIDADALRLVP
ncbi:MAG TPA: secretion system protein E, partial [Methyloversatilis sp.]